MIRVLLRAVVFLGSAALGLLVASLIVPEMSIDGWSFAVVVVMFAVLQSVLAPFILKMAMRSASALVGAAGLISTVVSLLITSTVLDGLRITGGPGPWVYASVVVWLGTMLGALVLPLLVLRRGAQAAGERRAAAA